MMMFWKVLVLVLFEAAEGVVEDFGGDVLAGALFEAVEAGGGVDFGDEEAFFAEEEVDAGDVQAEGFGGLFGDFGDFGGEFDFFGVAAAGDIGFELALGALAKCGADGFATDDHHADVAAEGFFDAFLEDQMGFAFGGILEDAGDFAQLALGIEF